MSLGPSSYAQWTPKATSSEGADTGQSIELAPINKEDERIGQKILIDQQEYFVGDIIEDFLSVAFSEKIWNEDASAIKPDGLGRMLDWASMQEWNLENPLVQERYQSAKSSMPWLADYLYRPNGWPKHNAINKWDEDVSVGLGWPGQKTGGENDVLASRVIKEFLPELSKEIGLNIRFNENDPLSATAKIRIILLDTWPRRNWATPTGYKYEIYDYEEGLLGGVLLHVADKSHMDAYILPDQNNRLGLAICKIKNNLPSEETEKLVKECLVRSLGLPDVVQTDTPSLLGENGATEITAYDKLMLKILYCQAIKPGMDKNQIVRVLISTHDCFH